MAITVGILVFYYILYQTQLVPRSLSVWGLTAVAGYVVPGVIALLNPRIAIWFMSIALQETA